MKRALVVLWCVAAGAGELRFQAEGKPLRLEVEKLGLLAGKKHQFEFQSYRGVVQYDAASPQRTRVELEVDASEFRLLDTWVSEKDRKKIVEYTHSKEMLETARFPKLTFRSEGVEKSGDESFRVMGQLTVHGVTKPVILGVKTREEGRGLRVEGQAVFRMTDFGLKPPSAALGAIRTKDEVVLRFDVLAE